jgi:hypothetical protein
MKASDRYFRKFFKKFLGKSLRRNSVFEASSERMEATQRETLNETATSQRIFASKQAVETEIYSLQCQQHFLCLTLQLNLKNIGNFYVMRDKCTQRNCL